MKIQKLPVEARSKLQSGIIITDAVQCVLELVHNSLDAGATGIAVRVDLKTYQIRVIDNGKGIGKDDLEFVGEKYMTSKYKPIVDTEIIHTYGFRGQALSSLRDVSRSLTIETKAEDGSLSFIKVIQNNKALPITEADSDRSGTGTIVTVDDFMYSMPVRRKHMNEMFDMEEMKIQLQYLGLIHYNVSFILRNESKGLILLQTPQASSTLESVANIYGKTIAKSLKALHYEDKNYEVNGFMSLKPQTQGNLQLLYINKRIISKGVIHKFVNRLIKEYCGKKSLFGDSPTGRILKRLKSLHNVFIIQIKCPNSHYELFTNVRKVTVEFRDWKDPLKCIHKAIKRAFRDAFSMDKSSNFHYPDDKAQCSREQIGVFGTSLLVNAVRGVAAKRGQNNRVDKSKKKVKLFNNKEKSALLPYVCKNVDYGQVVQKINPTVQQNECSNNTMESPMPKKSLNKFKHNCDSKLKTTDINHSFFEFYKWLKANFETDTQAFNLYNDFLQFKNSKILPDKVTQFRSPILGGKPRRKRALPVKETVDMKKKEIKKKVKTPSNNLSLLDEEIAIVTQRQLNIFSNQHLRMKKAVQFNSNMNSGIPDSLNFDCPAAGHFEMSSKQLYKKPKCVPVLRKKEKQIEYNQTRQSSSSSEVQFTNIIKFRNLSDSFCHRSSDGFFLPERPVFSASNTWVSHYQESENVSLHEGNQNMENFVSWVETNEKGKEQRKIDFEEFDFSIVPDRRQGERQGHDERVLALDVEVQVNMSSLFTEKGNAVVQTFQEILQSPRFGNSYTFSHGVSMTAVENGKENLEEQLFSENSFSQEPPNPDFWNSTTHMQSQFNHEQEVVYDDGDIASKKSREGAWIKKNSTSDEFVCGHKSQLSSKVESTSKDTQTFGAIWRDSLTEMGDPSENVYTDTRNLNNSKLGCTELSEPSTVSKTVPIEEINCDVAESGFCISERHDFVPKGLSPKFLNPENAPVASLSAKEKRKIKLTVDTTENEFLANIKWQNEFTGDCLKPEIPDGIIFEMRQKAGGNLMNYENPILSATLSYFAVKVHNLLHSFTFTKELLTGVEVLGQLDKKFIVTRMKISSPKKMELISLFDQHAADERIKLEGLIDENILPCGKFASRRLNPSIECILSESFVQIVSGLKEKLANFGLCTEPINENSVSVNEVPIFLLKKHEYDMKNKKETSLSDTVRALILNIIEEVTETRGAASTIPKFMHTAFCLEACHKAIKFNTALSVEDMTEIITKLQNCKLPFQCAHGRPSVIPIIDLEDFKPAVEESETLDFAKMRKFLKEREDSLVSVPLR